MERIEVGDPSIPFAQSRYAPRPLPRSPEQFPHRRGDGPIVGIDDVAPAMLVDRHVDLDDLVVRQSFDVPDRIEAVVEGRNIDIVHIEQQPTVGGLTHLSQELPFPNRRTTAAGSANAAGLA